MSVHAVVVAVQISSEAVSPVATLLNLTRSELFSSCTIFKPILQSQNPQNPKPSRVETPSSCIFFTPILSALVEALGVSAMPLTHSVVRRT